MGSGHFAFVRDVDWVGDGLAVGVKTCSGIIEAALADVAWGRRVFARRTRAAAREVVCELFCDRVADRRGRHHLSGLNWAFGVHGVVINALDLRHPETLHSASAPSEYGRVFLPVGSGAFGGRCA